MTIPFDPSGLIELPVLPLATPVESALAVMYAGGRSGALTIDHGQVALVHMRGVLRALREYGEGSVLSSLHEDVVPVTTDLVDLTKYRAHGRQWTLSTVPDILRRHGVLDATNFESIRAVHDQTRAKGQMFTLVSLGIGRGIVVSGSEAYGEPLQLVFEPCFCMDPVTPHYFRQPHPMFCDKDGTKVVC
jgi:hypothetical protein